MNDSKESIAWIGTGVMGAPMAGHLLAAGHPLHVHNRTRAKSDALVEAGAVWHDTPRSAAAESDIVCAIVGFPDDVRATILGPEGALAGLRAGGLVIDFTTSSPALAVEIAAAAEARGARALDAPVSGGDVGARDAALSIMVGGAPEAFARARPLLERLGRTVVHQGPAGSGQHTKMANQIVIAGTMVGVCESLLYARCGGLDPAVVLESIGGGAASSWCLNNLWPRVLADDFEPGFYVEHFVKDMGIALAECERMDLDLPGLSLVRGLYQELIDAGDGRLGTQALVRALERIQAT